MPMEEQLEIAASIEDYHKVFFVFWEMASINLTDEIKTACVRLPKKGKPELSINEDFWKNLNLRERLFVICHECLHVLLDHGVRNGMDVPGATHELVNIAQDITINEMIVDLFNYDREDLRDWNRFCWIDTCFKDYQLIKRNETFLYYLEKLIQNPPKDKADGGPSTFDEHSLPEEGTENSPGSGEPSQEEKEAREDLAATLAQDLTASELEKILNALPEGITGTGMMSGVLEHIIAKKTERLKINFANIIRKLKRSSMKLEEKDVDTFTHEDRRFSDAISRQNLSLPGKNAVDKPRRDRLLTAVFMDISGSCLEYMGIFNKVFRAFDEEKKIFDTRLFIFDTKVTAVKPGDNVYIGGGTSFDIIEAKCLQLAAEKGGRYPDCVVVITDGFGNKVEPKAPSKWIWLMTPKNSTVNYVPRNSRHFSIDQIGF